MSLSKKQMMAFGGGGLFVVAAGVLGWFLYDAWSVRTGQEEELETQMGAWRRYNEAPVFPSKKTIADVRTNAAELVAWRNEAFAFAARGDMADVADSPSVFKQRLATAVGKMRDLPGGAAGKIAAPAFLFGFDTYLGEGGVLPDQKDVPRLAAQLDAVTRTIVTFVKSGVVEVKEVVCQTPPAPTEAEEKAKKKSAKAKKGAAAVAQPSYLDYTFTFTARPAAIVKVLNAIAADKRFEMVTKFAFQPTEDDIVNRLDALAQAKAQAETAKTSGRRRRRHADAAEEAPAAEAAGPKAGPVADPEFGSPISVTLTLRVWDFATQKTPEA